MKWPGLESPNLSWDLARLGWYCLSLPIHSTVRPPEGAHRNVGGFSKSKDTSIPRRPRDSGLVVHMIDVSKTWRWRDESAMWCCNAALVRLPIPQTIDRI